MSNPLLRDTPTSDSKGNYKKREERRKKELRVEADEMWGVENVGFLKSLKATAVNFLLKTNSSFSPLLPSSPLCPLLSVLIIGSDEAGPSTHSINTCKDILSQ